MTIELTHGPLPAPGATRAPRWAERMLLAAALVRSAVQGLRDRLRLAADLRAASKRRRRRLRAWHPLEDHIFAELAQARAELEFTYRNGLDLR
jgi:hypothetical protein